jgi:hypothetical protein
VKITKGTKVAVAGFAAIAATVLCTASSCGNSNSGQAQENAQQKADTGSLEASQPLPHYDYSQIRQTLIDAETISANGTQTTSFFFQLGNQDPVYSCPSLGEPVANSSSLSNPQQGAGVSGVSGAIAIGQMDPDGIYTPTSSSGTYVICLNTSGQPYLDYWEGDVFTVSGAAEWDTATHAIKVTGAPTAAVHTGPGGSEKAPAPSK